MEKFLNEYVTILMGMFKYDVEVFSKPWLYIPLLIPACFYLVFFFIKWIVLTSPIWIPCKIILKGFTSLFNNSKNELEDL